MKKKYVIYPNTRFIFGLDDMASALVLSSIFGAGTSLAGGIANSFGQASANKTMIEEAQKNRDWQHDEAQLQRDFTENMWNKVNEYNTPANQLQRMRDAHINPLSQGFAQSTAQNVSTPAVPSSPSMPQIGNPLSGVGQGLMQASQSALNIAQARKLDTETKGNEIDNAWKERANAQQFEFMGAKIETEKANKAYIEKEGSRIDEEITSIIQSRSVELAKLSLDAEDVNTRRCAEQFNEWLQTQKLSIEQKQLAVNFFNAFTSRMVAQSGIDLNKANVSYLGIQGNRIEVETGIEADKHEAVKPTLGVNAWINTLSNLVGVVSDCFNLKNLIVPKAD